VVLETGKIDSLQFIFLMVGFIMGSSVVLMPGQAAAHDAWIAILIGLAEAILFVLVYSILGSRFRNKTLIEINEVVYGPLFGKLISLAFLGYILHLGSLVIGDFKDFLSVTVLPQTPYAIIVIFITLVCVYAVKSGIEVIARCGQILTVIIVGIFLIAVIFLVKDINLKNLQPILEVPVKDLLVAAHGTASFPFAETVVFIMLIPFLKNHKNIPITVVKSLLIGGCILVFVAIRNASALGNIAGICNYQNFQADRLIDVGHFLSRMEILTVIAMVTMGFIKITILLYGVVLGSAQLLGLRSYRLLVIPIAILMIILSLINFKSFSENVVFAFQFYPIYAPLFEFGIPLLTLIVAMIRGLPKCWK
jgi:spore germination protein KB